jgi:hypothetical protein
MLAQSRPYSWPWQLRTGQLRPRRSPAPLQVVPALDKELALGHLVSGFGGGGKSEPNLSCGSYLASEVSTEVVRSKYCTITWRLW